MSFQRFYIPPDPGEWPSYATAPAASLFSQIVHMFNLLEQKNLPLTHKTFALIGFNCDEGIRRMQGRTGAASGPNAIRNALGHLPTQKQDYQLFDAGNITCIDGNLDEAQQ